MMREGPTGVEFRHELPVRHLCCSPGIAEAAVEAGDIPAAEDLLDLLTSM